MTVQSFVVRGMTCGHCVHAVSTEVAKIVGVREVQVDLASGLVTIDSDVPVEPATLAAAVDEAGYEIAP